MYNKYKNKYLIAKKMIGGTQLPSFMKDEEFRVKVIEILNGPGSDLDKFNKIDELTELIQHKKNSPHIFYVIKEGMSLFEIILNFDIRMISNYLNQTFAGFVEYFKNKIRDKTATSYFTLFIDKIIAKINTNEIFRGIFLSQQNHLIQFIRLLLFFDRIAQTNEKLTTLTIKEYETLSRSIEYELETKYIKAFDFYISKNDQYRKILNSINMYAKIIYNLDINEII
jgi:hypothetical protein